MVAAAAGIVVLAGTSAPATASHRHDAHHGNKFTQTNLVSDIKGLAGLTDSHLKNPWGIAFGPKTPLWSSNQADNTSTLYTGTNRGNVAQVPLVVKASSPTGIVFNSTSRFVVKQNGVTAPAKFIFAETKFGPGPNDPPVTSITAWHNGTSTVPGSKGKVGGFYGGLALVTSHEEHSGPRLLAADNAPGGNIDVYDSHFKRVKPDKKHAFIDPNINLKKTPPYNVAFLKGRVYVTYAPPFGAKGRSAISEFSPSGKFHKRLVSGRPLNGPWGLAVAPEHWGSFGGDLLVGNVFDGKIHAFKRSNGHFEGTLRNAHHKPIVNVGLWGLAFGNGVIGTPRTLVFAAGIGTSPHSFNQAYEHGLVGLIAPVSKHHH